MPLVTGPTIVQAAFDSAYAVPAINVVNMETAQAVIAAAEECGSPVILQISPGAIAYAGYETITRLVHDAARAARTPVVVHLDHCRDPDVVRRALDDGFGSIMFDGSRLDDEENVRITRQLVEEARPYGAAVEGELGYIGGSEDSTLDEAREAMTSPERAADFVAATGIDIMAPAIGSLHRMPEDSVELDAAAIRRVAEACRRPLALHGGSGVRRDQLRAVIDAGIAKVNISSQVGRAFAAGLQRFWQEAPGEVDPRRYLAAGRDELSLLAASYMRICASAGRAPAIQGPRSDQPFEPE
jgi:fructose-bisphosphate aldolase class II